MKSKIALLMVMLVGTAATASAGIKGSAVAGQKEEGLQKNDKVLAGLADLILVDLIQDNINASSVSHFYKKGGGGLSNESERLILPCLKEPRSKQEVRIERDATEFYAGVNDRLYFECNHGALGAWVWIGSYAKFAVIDAKGHNGKSETTLVYRPNAPRNGGTIEELQASGAVVSKDQLVEAFKVAIPKYFADKVANNNEYAMNTVQLP